MAITVVCRCGRKLTVKDELIGKRGKCPACGATISVPNRAAGTPTPSDPSVRSAPTAGQAAQPPKSPKQLPAQPRAALGRPLAGSPPLKPPPPPEPPPPETPPPGSSACIQVLMDDGSVEHLSVEIVRQRLMKGTLTRRHKARWVEPMPRLEDCDLRDLEQATEELVARTAEWELRREWRPIGEGLAKEESAVQVLYDPDAVYGVWWGLGIGCVVWFVLLGAAVMYAGPPALDWLKSESANVMRDAHDSAKFGFGVASTYLIVVFLGGLAFIAITLISIFAGMVLGIPLGRLWAKLAGSRLPRPPDDGYSAKG